MTSRRTRVVGAAAARREIAFDFEGRSVTACEGDSIAAALIAAGVHVFGRSSKYHRPRGYRCGRGHCSACAMRVDGLPGVRTCVTPVQPGMRVEREHAAPTADHDLLRATELVSPLVPPGFYYRWFRRSPRLWNLMERAVARASGQGSMPDPRANDRFAGARCVRRDGPDVLVVGGGPAGLAAALAAAEDGAEVLLVDGDDRLGGRALDVRPRPGAPREVDTLIERVAHEDRVEVLVSAPAIGWYDEGVLAVALDPDLLLCTPKAVVVATGAYDRGLPFADWDLPGVVLAGGAQRLIHRYGVRPWSRAVVLTTDEHGYEVARDLADAGIEIACLADTRPPSHDRDPWPGETATIPRLHRATTARAYGRTRVAALSVSVDSGARPHRYECDLVVISAGLRPADNLAFQARAGGSIVLSTAEPAPASENLWLAGLAAGCRPDESVVEHGAEAGRRAAYVARGSAHPRSRRKST